MTMPRSPMRPNVGFLFIVLSYSAAAAFFAWAHQRPPLDTVWQLQHELQSGHRTALSASDALVLSRALDRHPKLARALLSDGDIGVLSQHDGSWVGSPQFTVLRTPGCKKNTLRVKWSSPDRHRGEPVLLQVSGPDWHEMLSFTEASPSAALPPPRGHHEVLTLRLEPPAQGHRSDLALEVTFLSAQGAQGGPDSPGDAR